MSYVEEKELNLVVHEAKNLKAEGIHHPPNPFVRVQIVNGETLKKRKKTEVKKETWNPNFDKGFKVTTILILNTK